MIQRNSVFVVSRCVIIVRALLVGFVVFLGTIIYAVDTGSFSIVWDGFNRIPMADKVGHLVLMGTLSLLANLSLRCRKVSVFRLSVMLGTLVVTALVGAEEISQAFIPSRTCDFGDFVADMIGILGGGAIAKWWMGSRFQPGIADWDQGRQGSA